MTVMMTAPAPTSIPAATCGPKRTDKEDSWIVSDRKWVCIFFHPLFPWNFHRNRRVYLYWCSVIIVYIFVSHKHNTLHTQTITANTHTERDSIALRLHSDSEEPRRVGNVQPETDWHSTRYRLDKTFTKFNQDIWVPPFLRLILLRMISLFD